MNKHNCYAYQEINQRGRIINRGYIVIRPEYAETSDVFTLFSDLETIAYDHFNACAEDSTLDQALNFNDFPSIFFIYSTTSTTSSSKKNKKGRTFLLEPVSSTEIKEYQREFSDILYDP